MVRPYSFFLCCLNRGSVIGWTFAYHSSASCRSHCVSLSAVPASTTATIRCRARIAYDGSSFAGFQIQQQRSSKQTDTTTPKRTIQGDLEAVLTQRFSEFCSDQFIRVVAAGRTDAGVHARGQAIHFDVCVEDEDGDPKGRLRRELPSVQRSIDAMLPQDLVLWNLQVAPEPLTKIIAGETVVKEWNAMYDCTLKWYSYRIHVGPVMDPLERHFRWHPSNVDQWFNEIQFRRLLETFQGRHDFRAFASAMERLEASRRKLLNDQKESAATASKRLDPENDDEDDGQCLVDTFRTIRSVRLVPEQIFRGNANNYPCHSYRIDFLLEGALYKQVRNMVGTVVDVCAGRVTESQFFELLNPSASYGRRDNRSKPAPAQGLTLEHVFFEAQKRHTFRFYYYTKPLHAQPCT
ncbi:hypothetical protein ACA910_018134 [Epithemia clementina (nom. ined.)]